MPAPHHHGDEHLRQLLSRKDLASARQRIALGRRLGLAENEVLALAYLARHGELTPSALGRLLGLSSGGATTLAQRLERAGHVERADNPQDGRSNLLHLTPGTVTRLGWRSRRSSLTSTARPRTSPTRSAPRSGASSGASRTSRKSTRRGSKPRRRPRREPPRQSPSPASGASRPPPGARPGRSATARAPTAARPPRARARASPRSRSPSAARPR